MIEDEKPVSEEPQDIVIDTSETGLAEDGSEPVLDVVDYAQELIEASSSVPVFNSAPEPVWKKLLRQMLGTPDSETLQQRVNELNRAIADDPEAAINYVLRGEAYLQTREYALAYADFQQGLEMATTQVEQNDWGIVAQAVQDRAAQGLKVASKRLTN